ncbi:MAG: tRNA uridine-5-carboxymethylaminomethyl(34) synthesis GTPase MnmE [Rickettsiales bacterium]
MQPATTIYAIATPPGKSGVAVFRLSGPGALSSLTALGVKTPLAPRMATLVTLYEPRTPNPEPRKIDTVLALTFPAPHSFTGEDVLELHTHGSRIVTRLLLDALATIPGLRLAEPGEFARRAFHHGKFDLAQAEAIADLIDADTASQHAQALRQLGGGLTARVEALRARILEPLALLEAYIDFPDEEIPDSVLAQTQTGVAALAVELDAMLADRGIGEKIREGIEIIILGAPNAGKSSLMNALARRDIAIVSPEAGTTRDLLEVQLDLGGYAVTLIDTAGLRETTSGIEAEGIRRALARAERAELKLHLVDLVTSTELSSLEKLMSDKNTLLVLTKSDLATHPKMTQSASIISTSTGDGMEALISRLQSEIALRMESATSPLITRARHRESLALARDALSRFRPDLPLELACEELRHAATAIGKITGKIAVDDVLDLVFSRFCIGK